MQAIIFDMDDTLYSSRELKNRYRVVAYGFIARCKKISRQQAIELHQDELSVFREKYNYTPQNWKIVERLGLSWDEWALECINHLDPRQYLKRDPQLAVALTQLLKKYRLAVLTNNNRIQTQRILEILGINNLFDTVLTVSETGRKKPDQQPFIDVVDQLGCGPEQCIMVGDDADVDLQPAQSMNMQTILVQNVSDVYKLPDHLL